VNCTRISSVAGRYSGIKSQPRKLKGPGESLLPRPFAISTKNKHLLAIYSIPARGFTAAVSVFEGTPPPKPFDCKIRFALPGCAIEPSRAHHIGDDSKLVFAKLGFAPEDII